MFVPRRSFASILTVTLLAVILGTGCPAPPSEAPVQPAATSDPFEDRTAIVEAHESLLAAMERGDGDAVAALLDDQHDLLVFHPAVEDRLDGPQAIADGVRRMMGRVSPLDVTEVHLQVWVDGDVGWLTSHLLLESPELDEAFPARGTEIWRRADDGWKLGHAHWSESPPPR